MAIWKGLNIAFPSPNPLSCLVMKKICLNQLFGKSGLSFPWFIYVLVMVKFVSSWPRSIGKTCTIFLSLNMKWPQKIYPQRLQKVIFLYLSCRLCVELELLLSHWWGVKTPQTACKTNIGVWSFALLNNAWSQKGLWHQIWQLHSHQITYYSHYRYILTSHLLSHTITFSLLFLLLFFLYFLIQVYFFEEGMNMGIITRCKNFLCVFWIMLPSTVSKLSTVC